MGWIDKMMSEREERIHALNTVKQLMNRITPEELEGILKGTHHVHRNPVKWRELKQMLAKEVDDRIEEGR